MAPAVDDIADACADTIAVATIDIEESPDIDSRGDEQIARHVGGLTRTRLAMMLDDALDSAGYSAFRQAVAAWIAGATR